jgi:hypothetical protein
MLSARRSGLSILYLSLGLLSTEKEGNSRMATTDSREVFAIRTLYYISLPLLIIQLSYIVWALFTPPDAFAVEDYPRYRLGASGIAIVLFVFILYAAYGAFNRKLLLRMDSEGVYIGQHKKTIPWHYIRQIEMIDVDARRERAVGLIARANFIGCVIGVTFNAEGKHVLGTLLPKGARGQIFPIEDVVIETKWLDIPRGSLAQLVGQMQELHAAAVLIPREANPDVPYIGQAE